MLQELEERCWDLEDKKAQTELTEQKTVSQKKNTLCGIDIRVNIAKEKIGKLEDIAVESIQNEKLRQKKSKANKQRSGELWDNFKC